MNTGARYTPSPLHQGTRTRTGTQPEREFVAKLLAIVGDCRLLWLPDLTDTTTSQDRSRNGATITWSESLAVFDAPRTRLGSGVAAEFNGSDERGSVPDAGRYTFGDGASDEPFSVIALVSVDATATQKTIAAKWDATTGVELREWRFYADTAEKLGFDVYDESAGAYIAGWTTAALTPNVWTLAGGTYDGSKGLAGFQMFVNGQPVARTDASAGSYAGMEDTATAVSVGFSQGPSAAENHFDGKIALVLVAAAQLSVDQMWAIKEACNAYFGLSL